MLAAALAASLPAPPARAAEAPASAATEQAQDNSAETQSTASTAPSEPPKVLTGDQQRRADDTGGVFLPSENISEDLPLAFPVDI